MNYLINYYNFLSKPHIKAYQNLTTTKTDSLDIELEENRAKKIAELQSLSDQDLLHKMQKLKQRAYR